MRHLTLNTGHVRESPRSEVRDDVIAALLPPLLAHLGTRERWPLPGPAGYSVSATADGDALIATVWREGSEPIPLVTLGVAPSEAAARALWPLLLRRDTSAVRPLAPWCAVRLEQSAVLDPAALEWLGDFERCLAWAWLERKEHLS